MLMWHAESWKEWATCVGSGGRGGGVACQEGHIQRKVLQTPERGWLLGCHGSCYWLFLLEGICMQLATDTLHNCGGSKWWSNVKDARMRGTREP